ncbi:MAG: serine/threonine-protein phosphatase, partial [Anaerolineales bacterium]|nr:serine/threonine-protein phosphatase [Anaerolineales bacterium]
RDKGERAAQLAKDSVLDALQRSMAPDVPTALSQAVQYAAQVVYNETSKYPGTSTTLVVAVIQEGKQLFVANVGDSRIYLCRNKKITQLTLDHIFANMMAIEGVMSWEAAQQNPRAHVVMRALGPSPAVEADLGFYVNTMDPEKAAARGIRGIPLQTGDSVLVCSDGLIKDGPDGLPYIREDEIWQVVSAQEGDKAARSLVSFALGRDANDNVSVALLQTEDPNRKTVAKKQNPKRAAFIAGGAIGAVALILLGIMAIFFTQQADSQQAIAEQTREVEVALTTTAVAATAQAQEQNAANLVAANNATATAQAKANASNVQQRETEIAQTATAQAQQIDLRSTQDAQELICLRPENYGLTFLNGVSDPILQPAPP